MLYAFSLTAQRYDENRHLVTKMRAAASVAPTSQNEAVGVALDLCLRLFPESDGWFGHGVVTCEIPPGLAQRAIAEAEGVE